ncbi:hypothetical protein [Parabacteroides sp.]|uniref:hypothetical protein n=1 Tax=Parabacteroides sp. TaxID=1869337 RepID=UPI0026DF3B08|nr:hypothetical protein [Parabacteroides sp.]MDO5427590.1 hypothetical protein [Parabacteroides sp.]
MKKKYFLSAIALCGLMTLASCGSDDDPIPEKGGDEPEVAAGEQVIILDMQDTDVLSTKSRPLYSTSNKGAELVTDVKVLVFKTETDNQKKLVNVIYLEDWANTSSDYNYGRKRKFKLTGDNKLDKDGEYTFIAVGQQEGDGQDPKPYKIYRNRDATTTDGTNIPDFLKDFNASTNSYTWNSSTKVGDGFILTEATTDADAKRKGEIFSGQSIPVTLKVDKGFTLDIVLKRQVAGILGYFSRIPAYVKNANATDDGNTSYTAVKSIRLVASGKNNQLDLTHQLDIQKDDTAPDNGDMDGVIKPIENVMNGFNAEQTKDAKFESSDIDDAYVVYTIDLTKWFPGGFDEGNSAWNPEAIINSETGDPFEGANYGSSSRGTHLLGNTAAWVNAIDAANATVKLATGSVFAGEFTIPFSKVDKTQTLQLQLLDKDGNILKSWSVKLDVASQKGDDSADVYSIYRNHLYQLGKRGDGDDPDKPGTDPDEPQPLDKDQELVIKINDQWEFIHDMEIE